MARTGLVYREEALLHDAGRGHSECPQRLEAILQAFDRANVEAPRIAIEPATREDLLRAHTAAHVDTIKATCASGAPYPDPDTRMGAGSWQAALLAAGGAIAACRAVLEGAVDNVFVAMRPPGHHAEADRAMGFCLFNNVVIAAKWLRDVAGLERVAILDWDVHHGNGTQHILYDDTTVFYASIHQHPLYPGTGMPHERGKDNTNLNIQRAPGDGHEQWISALRDQALPEIERFRPDFVLISCGFDAHRRDPLASQRLEADSYAEMTRLAKGLAGGRVVSLLEGGYHIEALAESALAHFRELQA